MATSGSVDYSTTRNLIIQDAFSEIGVLRFNGSLANQDMAFANRKLNDMIKAWNTKGLHLWTKSNGVLFLDQGTAAYTLSNTSTAAHVTNADTALTTELGADASSGDTTVTVDSSAGAAASDKIGFELDDGSIQWTTISSVTDSTTIVIAAALTGDAATDNNVYIYTTRINKPLRILNATLAQGTSTNVRETPMTAIGQEDYRYLSFKGKTGIPLYYYYDSQLSNGKLYLWPCPTDTEMRVLFTYERSLDDMDNSTDEPDFPIEWREAIVLNLAARLFPSYGKGGKVSQDQLLIRAQIALDDILGWDREIAPIQFVPDMSGRE